MSIRLFLRLSVAALMATAVFGAVKANAQTTPPVTQVAFPSMDGSTTLRGFLYRPTTGTGPFPAIVLMHGCGGAYSKTSSGKTLTAEQIEASPSKFINSQFRDWAAWGTARGYVVLLVDGFGPRGETLGVCDIPWETRAENLDEVRRRPLDAFGGLKYLRDNATTLKVRSDRVALVGWSNGASATLSTVAETGPQVWHQNTLAGTNLIGGFSMAVTYYPGCGLDSAYNGTYRATVPMQMFVGSADTTTPPVKCDALKATAEQVAANSGQAANFTLKSYTGASHSFDMTSSSSWSSAQTTINNAAKADARAIVDGLFTATLKN